MDDFTLYVMYDVMPSPFFSGSITCTSPYTTHQDRAQERDTQHSDGGHCTRRGKETERGNAGERGLTGRTRRTWETQHPEAVETVEAQQSRG